MQEALFKKVKVAKKPVAKKAVAKKTKPVKKPKKVKKAKKVKVAPKPLIVVRKQPVAKPQPVIVIPVVNKEAVKAEKKAKRAAKREKKFAPQETEQQEYVNLRTFQLKMSMKGGRIVYVNKEKSGPDHLLMLAKKPSKSRSLFILDKRTSSIRLASAPHLAMSNQATRGVKLGGNVVLRKYNESKT